jgi:predicted RNase H-like nuclease (RuvC/YqgF family)
MEDDIQLKEQKIDEQEKKLQESRIQNDELKRIIMEKNKEIERLKNK